MAVHCSLLQGCMRFKAWHCHTPLWFALLLYFDRHMILFVLRYNTIQYSASNLRRKWYYSIHARSTVHTAGIPEPRFVISGKTFFQGRSQTNIRYPMIPLRDPHLLIEILTSTRSSAILYIWATSHRKPEQLTNTCKIYNIIYREIQRRNLQLLYNLH